MKKVFIIALLIAGSMMSCSKDNSLGHSITTPAPKPVAAFSITNSLDDGWILEGSTINFDNQSKNSVSYYWDFSNGVTSMEKTPSNISFSPCGQTYKISLTVTNKAGETASFSQTFNIQCSGKHPYNGG